MKLVRDGELVGDEELVLDESLLDMRSLTETWRAKEAEDNEICDKKLYILEIQASNGNKNK